MDFYFDSDVRIRRMDGCSVKRGDVVPVKLYLADDVVSGVLGVKAKGDLAGDYVAMCNEWTKVDGEWTGSLALNTTGMASLFTAVNGVVPDCVSVECEFEFIKDSGVLSSQRFSLKVENDLIKGDEGVPTDTVPDYITRPEAVGIIQSEVTSEVTSAFNEAKTEVAGMVSQANSNAITASAKATQASNSATSAQTSATTATAKASEASSSATSAQTSASTATTKASEASASATSAAESLAQINNAVTDAQASATTATAKASEASSSATSAQTSATTATTKASEASTSATSAAQSLANINTVIESKAGLSQNNVFTGTNTFNPAKLVLSGGSAGQILAKTSTGTTWVDAPSGGGGSSDVTLAGNNVFTGRNTFDGEQGIGISRNEFAGSRFAIVPTMDTLSFTHNVYGTAFIIDEGVVKFDLSRLVIQGGTAGQILSSTGGGLAWINAPSGGGGDIPSRIDVSSVTFDNPISGFPSGGPEICFYDGALNISPGARSYTTLKIWDGPTGAGSVVLQTGGGAGVVLGTSLKTIIRRAGLPGDEVVINGGAVPSSGTDLVAPFDGWVKLDALCSSGDVLALYSSSSNGSKLEDCLFVTKNDSKVIVSIPVLQGQRFSVILNGNCQYPTLRFFKCVGY